MTDDWRGDKPCVLNDQVNDADETVFGECIAVTLSECACRKMPDQVYLWYLNGGDNPPEGQRDGASTL